MDRPDPIPLAFDDVVIDFAGRRLLRGGRPQALEPKAFDVLALLAQAPGRVFTRDEILDAVWGHRYVTPGVLNRVVTLLRHALGEDAHAPHYLHTLHGVGYRFDPGARAAPPRPPGAPGAPWRRLGWLLLPLLALMLAAAWYLRPRAEPVAAMPVSSAARPAPMPVLVVMPLKPIGLGEGVRILADGLSEEMIGSLARIDGLRVIARESTRLAAAETRDPAQLAQRLDATHSLEGSLQQDGQSLRIRLRLVDAGSGSALWTRDFDRHARAELEKAGAGGAYARWFNAVWRRDHAQALRIATTQIGAPDNDDPNAALLVPGYVAVSHALIDPERWPQALAEFDTYERNAVFWNFSRVLAPDAPAHAPEFIARLNEMRRRNYSSWDLLLWTKDVAWLRRDPAFQDYLRDTGILAYWRRHGFPQQCRPVGEGAACA